jgi:hypothetical protein
MMVIAAAVKCQKMRSRCGHIDGLRYSVCLMRTRAFLASLHQFLFGFGQFLLFLLLLLFFARFRGHRCSPSTLENRPREIVKRSGEKHVFVSKKTRTDGGFTFLPPQARLLIDASITIQFRINNTTQTKLSSYLQ